MSNFAPLLSKNIMSVTLCVCYLLLHKNYHKMKWLKITYNYCLTVPAGWWSRLGLAVSSASGCHRLQWRCQLRLGSHLRPDWGGIFFQVPVCCQDSAPRGLWGLGPWCSAGCESEAALGSLPHGPVQQVGCFIKACIWESKSAGKTEVSLFQQSQLPHSVVLNQEE